MNKTKIIILIISVLTIIITALFFFTKPEGMIYSMLIGSLLLYFFVRIPEYQSNKAPDDFFLYNREMPKNEFVPTFVASNIGLFSSITFSAILAYYYGIGGMFFTTFAWFFGMYLFSKAIPRLLPFFKVGQTLHEFIAQKFGKSDSERSSIRVWTSIISSTLYFASIGIEIKVGADFFAPTLGNVESIYIALLIAVIGIGYSYLSGYKGVVFTDYIQFFIMGAATIAIIVFSVLHVSSNISMFVIPDNYLSFPNVLFSPEPFGLLVLVILLILYQFCIMDMWQRCIAIAKTKKENGESYSDSEIIRIMQERTFKKAIFPFLWFFIAWFLIGFIALATNLTDDYNNIIPAFLSAFETYGKLGILLKAIIFTGFSAAVLSTVDTFLVATVQTIMYDIYGVKFAPGLSEKISTLPEIQKYRFVHISRSILLLVGILSVSIAFIQANLLSFWTGMYSIMLPFFSVVWIAIKSRENLYSYIAIKLSVLIGFFGTAILGVLGTFIYQNPNFVYGATIFAVFSPIIILKLSRINKKLENSN